MSEISRAAPLVCICVPTFNAERTLAETLESILGQTYRELTVLVVDNASTDKTLEIADSYAAADRRVRVHRNSANVGGEGNFTRCLALACGDYTGIFHSDDIYTAEMVARQVALLESRPEAGAVFSMAQLIDERGVPGRIYKLPPELRRDKESVYDFKEIFRALLKYGNFFFCPGVLARTAVYRDYIRKWDGGGFLSSADLDVWLRILLRHKIGIIDEPLLRYRGGAASSFSYTAARKKTAPHDMLPVFDAYIQGAAAGLMGRRERADYSLLVLKDKTNRAFNYFTVGDGRTGRGLLGGLFSPGSLLHSLRSAFHLKVMLYGYAVYFLSWLPLSGKARAFIASSRFKG